MYLYLHVPFCASHCIYCDFYVVLSKYGGQEAYIDAVCREIHLRLASRHPVVFESLYIGGGTPSLLPIEAYQKIFSTLTQYGRFAPQAEITLEANPNTPLLQPTAYRALGINRLSIGVQSLDNKELRKLSRSHTAEEACRFIEAMHGEGFHNLSVDLMYGIPEQSLASWQNTLERIVTLNVSHISAYGLKVEPATPLARLVQLGAYPLPDEDTSVAMYQRACKVLGQAGFQRYEFSNFTKAGYTSSHNLNYWNNGEYLALGPGAHGYLDGTRYATVRDLARYIENPLEGTQTACPAQERLENAIIFGLRKTEGIDVPSLEAEYGINFRREYGRVLEKYVSRNLLQWEGERLRLSEAAIPASNLLLAEFIG